MANPQKENGHVDIANEIVEYMARYRLSGQEWQVLWVILRKTWGWHKKKDRISLGYIAKMTLMKRPAVARAINKLVNKGVIKKDNSYTNIYMFNKDYETWKSVIKKDTLLSKEVTPVIKRDNRGVIKKDNKSVIKKDTTTKEKKEKIKETITKEKGIDFINTWKDFKTMRKKIRKPMTERAEELIIQKLDKLASSELIQIAILNQSIMNSWQGVFSLKEISSEYDNGVMEILNYLNKRTGKNYTINIPDKVYIVTRLKEGRSIENFKKIIDIKCNKWKGKLNKDGNLMEDYLTPKTLFGINFENYLNEPEEDKFSKYMKKE